MTEPVEWRQFDEIDLKNAHSPLLAQLVDYIRNLEAEGIPRDTYTICPMCEKLEQLKDSKTKQLLESLDHLRFYGGDGDLPKKLASFRLKPSIHHVIIENPVVNKQYTVKLSLSNKSHLTAEWRILTPNQFRQSVFFSAHPSKGTIEPGKQGGLSLELVLLDARDFHRLVVIETRYGEHFMTYGAILMTAATAAYPEGAVVSQEVDLGDVDLESCYWSVRPTDLHLVSISDTYETPTHKESTQQKSVERQANGLGSKNSKRSIAVQTIPVETSSASSPRLPHGLNEVVLSPSSDHLPEGKQYRLFNVPVHVKKVSLSDESDRSEFWHEVNMMSSLRHPHLVNLIGASSFADDGQLITRIFDHGDLRSFLLSNGPELNEHKSLLVKVNMLIGLSQALHFVHSFNRIHRSISAANVFLTEEFDVKLTAPQLRLHNSVACLQRTIVGDEAPEVATEGRWSESADIFSFGLLMWELLNEKRPDRTEEQVRQGFVPELSTATMEKLKKESDEVDAILGIMNTCLALNPSDRISSKLLSRKIAKLAIATQPKPGHLNRRKTRERGLGGRVLKKSANENREGGSHLSIAVDSTHTSSEVSTSPHKKTSSTSSLSPAVKKRTHKAPKPPPSPALIDAEASKTHERQESDLANADEETEPRRITAEFVLEKTGKSKSHKSKK